MTAHRRIESLAQIHCEVDAAVATGPLDVYRHSFGHGGINPLPIPRRVQQGLAKCEPRLSRIFIQEFFDIYPEHERFDWSRLDSYMHAIAGAGGRVVASICIKPKLLFPAIDDTICQPNDAEEWQRVIAALVQRYSVDRQMVTHWEIGNEVDIGEQGGCPYKIQDPDDYTEWYRMTIDPILKVFPGAKVGGSANAGAKNGPLAGFISRCQEQAIQLDFVSYHVYSSDPGRHIEDARYVQGLLERFADPKPETMVTEFSPGFERASTQDQAFELCRAACIGSIIVDMIDAGVDWSFHYHAWDQWVDPADFAPFFKDTSIMTHHWNEVPHRFGLFGVNEEVRPTYFVYRLLCKLGEHRLATVCESPAIRMLAAQTTNGHQVFFTNYQQASTTDQVAVVNWQHLSEEVKTLTLYRIDEHRAWDEQSLQINPIEQRTVWTGDHFQCHVYLPADSVALLRLTDAGE